MPGRGVEAGLTFSDGGVSGHATGKRTGFAAMLAFCEKDARAGRPLDCIVCWKSDRRSRSDSQCDGIVIRIAR